MAFLIALNLSFIHASNPEKNAPFYHILYNFSISFAKDWRFLCNLAAWFAKVTILLLKFPLELAPRNG